jgi:hypothetical protein
VAEGWTVEGELDLQSRRYDDARLATNGAGRGLESGQTVTATAAATAAPPPRRSAGRSAPMSKDAYRRQRQLVDGELTRLGLRRGHLELALGDPQTQANFVELRRISSELADVDAALAQAEEAWLVLEERAPR